MLTNEVRVLDALSETHNIELGVTVDGVSA